MALLLLHTASKQSHRTPHLRIYRLKEGALLPAMFNLYSAVQINNCLKRTFVTKVATTDDLRNNLKPSCAIDTFRGEQR